jgi:hypothetical protein
VGLSIWLIGGLIYGLLLTRESWLDKIEPAESFEISILREGIQKALQNSPYNLVPSLIAGLIFGMMMADGMELIEGLWFGLIFGLIVGLSIGVIYPFMVTVLNDFVNGFKQELKVRLYPNQGIWRSLQILIWISIFFYLLWMFVFALIALSQGITSNNAWIEMIRLFSNYWFILIGLLLSLFFGFSFGGGISCIQHFSLRVVLWQSGTIPWNFARFLNYCVERRLLLRVGGRYRFLHRELLDYFAQLPPGTQIK